MTSAEFAATYRVLKTLTEQGARSQIAQEVALGRMVMVHTLDVGTTVDRQRLRAGVGSLQSAAAEQVLGVYDVEGMTTVVTRFLTTFTDLPTWIRDNALPDDANTQVIAALPAKPSQVSEPVTRVPVAAKQDSGFTAIFAPAAVASPDVSPAVPPVPSFKEVSGAGQGAQAPPRPPQAPAASQSTAPPPLPLPPPATNSPPPAGGESFTQIFSGAGTPLPKAANALTPPPAQPVTQRVPDAQAPAPPASKPSEGFTQVFGGLAPEPPAPASPAAALPVPATSAQPASAKRGQSFSEVFGSRAAPVASNSPAPASPPPVAPRFDAVMPPQVPEAPRPEPAALPPKTPSGDFTQLFDRLTPAMSVPAHPRPQAPPPAAPVAPTPLWTQPAPSASTPPAPTWQAPPEPPRPAGSVGSPAPAGPSEFTRILGKVSLPPSDAGAPSRTSGGSFSGAGLQMPQIPQLPQMPQMPQAPQVHLPGMQVPPMQLPQAQIPTAGLTPLSVPQQAAGNGPATTRSHLPLIIALNVLLIAAIGLVLYFVLKH